MRIRPATAADARAIADLHAASWRDAYRPFMSADFLDGPLTTLARDHWRDAMVARDRRDIALIAEEGSTVVGFAALAASAEAPTQAYLDNLHVDPRRRGGGIGRHLLREIAIQARASARRSAYLWVLAGNARGIAFYRRLGGAVGPETPDDVFGLSVTSRKVTWADIDDLIQACGPV